MNNNIELSNETEVEILTSIEIYQSDISISDNRPETPTMWGESVQY